MAYEPAMSGEIPMEGMLDVLRQIEERRISGRLRFTAENEAGQGETGEVELVAGQLALNQEALPDGTDPVERLLVLRNGIFVVHQRLPPLAVSQGDEQNKRGSLAVHAPTDLMTYCEQAGLTGTLKLINAGSLVDMIYEAGELLAIRADGKDSADLSHVFSWEDGRFEIGVGRDVRSLVPGGPPEDPADREPTTQFVRPGANDTGKHFLKVLEVALTDIVDRRERAQHKGKGQTSRAPAPSVRPRPPAIPPSPPKKKVREPTVRMVIMGSDDDAVAKAIDQSAGRIRSEDIAAAVAESQAAEADEPARQVKEKVMGEGTAPPESKDDEAAPEAEREAPPLPAAAPAPAPAPAAATPAARPPAPESLGSTVAWMATVLALGVAILAILAKIAM
jgi:hypothetical protein